jgi:hypothetical protein
MATKLPDEIPNLGPKGDRPKFNKRADLKLFKLGPTHGFVLSRIDGSASYEQICQLTGPDTEATLAILRQFKIDGLILGPNEPEREAKPQPPIAPTSSAAPPGGPPPIPSQAKQGPQKRKRHSTYNGPSLLERLDDRTPVDPAELTTGSDLDPIIKMRIIRMHRRLKKLGPYTTLGLPKGSDRDIVKQAFLAASKELHPDRYYGKDIGIFKDKLNDIFASITHASQLLEKKLTGERRLAGEKKVNL